MTIETEWLAPSEYALEYLRHETALAVTLQMPVGMSKAIDLDYDIPLLRQIAKGLSVKVAVIGHANAIELVRIADYGNVQLLYNWQINSSVKPKPEPQPIDTKAKVESKPIESVPVGNQAKKRGRPSKNALPTEEDCRFTMLGHILYYLDVATDESIVASDALALVMRPRECISLTYLSNKLRNVSMFAHTNLQNGTDNFMFTLTQLFEFDILSTMSDELVRQTFKTDVKNIYQIDKANLREHIWEMESKTKAS